MRDEPDDPQRLYDQRASFYDRVMNVIRHEATRTNLLRSLPLPEELPAGAQVLDIGCGTGLVTTFLVTKYPHVAMTGLDIAEKMLEIHHQRHPEVPLVIGDFNKGTDFYSFPDRTPVILPDNHYDLIISAGALSEYGESSVTIPWCYQLLKDRGVLINIGVHKNIFGEITGMLWKFKPQSSYAFIQACKAAGFRHAQLVTPTWQVFPKNLTDYTVRAEK